MKNAHEIVILSVSKAAAVIGLGLLASAQRAGGGEVREGRPVLSGSLENDIREGRGPRPAGTPEYWGEIRIDLASDLSLTVRLMGNEEIDPAAVLPLPVDLDKQLVLEGGKPGHVAMIELAPRPRGLQRRTSGLARGAVISGFFGANGEFEVDLPKELDVRGLGVRAARIADRTVTEVVDLEEAVEEAFAGFDPLGAVSGRPRAIGGGGMRELHRLSSGGGQALRAAAPTGFATREVDLSNDLVDSGPAISWQKLGDVAKPAGAVPGSGHELHRPSSGAGSAARAGAPTGFATREVDLSNDVIAGLDVSWQKLGDVDNPERAGGSGSKQVLRRLSRHTPHTGQR